VAEQLEPDLVAQVALDRSLEAAGAEGLRERAAALALAPVGLPEREARALEVADDAGLDELGRAVDDAPDRAAARQRARDHPPWVDRLEHEAVERPAVRLEVPPGDPVLRGDERRPRTEQRAEARRRLRERVRLEAQEDGVRVGDRLPVVGGRR